MIRRNVIRLGVMGVALACAVAARGEERTIYVSAQGNDEASGESWSQAKKTIPAAVMAAKDIVSDEQSATIRVSEGIYTWSDPVVLDAPIHIKGEASQIEDVVFRNGAKATWDSPLHRVFTLNHPCAGVSCAVIENGSVLGTAPGVLIDQGGGVVSNCVLRGHSGNSRNTDMPLGSVYLNGEAAVLTHSVISNCFVLGCDFNWVGNDGKDRYRSAGGVCVTQGRVENCLVSNCGVNGSNTIYPSIVGGIRAVGGTVSNCTVVACKGSCVGGIYASSKSSVVNCVAYDNVLSTAVHEFIDNGDGSITTNRCSDAVSVSPWMGEGTSFVYCAGDSKELEGSVRCRSGVTAADFKDYQGGDLVPSAKGLLMNAGVSPVKWAGLTDLAGKPRVKGRAIDIGCYEGNPPGLAIRLR